MSYCMSRTITGEFDAVEARVRAALAAQGFGVVTEIDMQATLRAKIGAEIDRHVILGACNPGFAHRALQVEPEIGLLLPCNVVIRAAADGIVVDVIDPQMMTDLAQSPQMQAIADEVGEKLSAALASV
ncbi:MAG: DUF302 domain-containing protein [Candidatus Nanopelagicales bacterium]|nr:DUF302 domain-containing protein [Candidatus Nanopelagicales bacterium]